MIKVTHLTKIYKTGGVEVVALNDISFEIKKGEFVAIMGPSGSGKSTLMHILGLLDVPTEGEYWLNGKLVTNLKDDELAEIRNKHIGFVFQAYNLLPRMSALKNVMVPMIYGNVAREERARRAQVYLEKVGLGERVQHTPNQLSGGQQQRVAIARALVMRPRIILADEPTGNISTQQALEIMQILADLSNQGKTIVIITHEREIAEHAERIIYLRDGAVVADEKNKKQKLLLKRR